MWLLDCFAPLAMTQPAADLQRDLHFMRVALALARRGLGNTWPNPAVGCVIARDHIIARGWTQPGGRPHAETEALARAGTRANGATAYVILEPCAHHGQTPPCAEALIAAGIARVVSPISDPDPRVSGRGFDMLRKAGITVETGLCADEAITLNAGFISRITRNHPLVTLKLATTLDGRIATHSGESKWITGEPARAYGHLLRAEHDAVMVGSTTAIQDDAELTCRLPGLEKSSPVRIVADGRLRLPLTAKLVRTAKQIPTWICTRPDADPARKQAYRDAGVVIIEIAPAADGLLDSSKMLSALAERGITRLLVEGGSVLSAGLIGQGFADRLAWFRAAKLIGGDGLAAVAALGLVNLTASPAYIRESVRPLGDDLLETYRRKS